MGILISAYLPGVECRYNGKGVLEPEIGEPPHAYHLIPVCPEIMGGLATPRTPVEWIWRWAVTRDDEDMTMAYQKGAETALKLAQLYRCRATILKERSPSYDRGQIRDGTSIARLTPGDRVCAGLLEQRGVRAYGENQITRLLEELERY